MNIKISRLFIFILLGCMFSGVQEMHSQQDSQFTQYMYNTVSVNPAYAGTRGSLSMLGIYRNQWVGLDGAPETLNFSANSPIGVQGVGLGLGFTSDNIGPSTESIITADFSYTIPISEGTKLSKLAMPYPASSVVRDGWISTGWEWAKRLTANTPPIKIPNTKNRFHTSLFQSYLKKGILAGMQDAQICRRDELIPNDLFPRIKRAGTVKPISGPAIYQGHGSLIKSTIIYCFSIVWMHPQRM